jgi:hypothetical protein
MSNTRPPGRGTAGPFSNAWRSTCNTSSVSAPKFRCQSHHAKENLNDVDRCQQYLLAPCCGADDLISISRGQSQFSVIFSFSFGEGERRAPLRDAPTVGPPMSFGAGGRSGDRRSCVFPRRRVPTQSGWNHRCCGLSRPHRWAAGRCVSQAGKSVSCRRKGDSPNDASTSGDFRALRRRISPNHCLYRRGSRCLPPGTIGRRFHAVHSHASAAAMPRLRSRHINALILNVHSASYRTGTVKYRLETVYHRASSLLAPPAARRAVARGISIPL